MGNNSNNDEQLRRTIGTVLFIIIVVAIVIVICLLTTNGSKSYTSNYSRSYSQRSGSWKQTTTSEQPPVTLSNGTIAVPYVGMSESQISNTSLGAPSSKVRHNRQVKNGQQYTANLYDYYKDGALIFTARCVQGKVIQVWDKRDNPVQPYKKSASSKSNSSKSSKKDEYNAKDYQNADDFYYDHYDDFYDYEEAEDYYNEHD